MENPADASPPPTPHPAAQPDIASAPTRLTDDLQAVLAHANGQPLKIRALVEFLRERGLAVVLIVTTTPFLLPIPTMGLSAPAGFAVGLYGLCVMFNLKPWLPGFMLNRELNYSTLEKLVGFGTRTGRRFEKLLKPRMKFMLWPGVNVLLGVSLILSGFYLSLPLPIPFSNAIPAAAILMILAGLIERDGVFVLAGQLITLALTVLFTYVVYLVIKYGYAGAKAILGFGDGEKGATTQQALRGTLELIGCMMY